MLKYTMPSSLCIWPHRNATLKTRFGVVAMAAAAQGCDVSVLPVTYCIGVASLGHNVDRWAANVSEPVLLLRCTLCALFADMCCMFRCRLHAVCMCACVYRDL